MGRRIQRGESFSSRDFDLHLDRRRAALFTLRGLLLPVALDRLQHFFGLQHGQADRRACDFQLALFFLRSRQRLPTVVQFSLFRRWFRVDADQISHVSAQRVLLQVTLVTRPVVAKLARVRADTGV